MRKITDPLFLSRFVMGLDESLLKQTDNIWLHQDTLEPLQILKAEARRAGFELRIVSGYRSFARQLFIWNAKALGQRPVLDEYGEPLDIQQLTDDQLMFAILRWSALPGGSRHHWGSDFDVVDDAAINEDYKIQLTVAETEGEGVFAPMHIWLNEYIVSNNLGFFRPYAIDLGGVAPEPWHLSFAPLAKSLQQHLRPELLYDLLADTDIELKQSVLHNFDEIFERFIWLDWQAYPE